MALEQIGVEATIQGLSSFRSGIGQMEGDVRGFGRTTDGLLPGLNSMGDSLLKIGGIAAGAVVAGLAAATGAAIAFASGGIKAAIDMEDQMGNIAATMNTTKDAIQPLADLIIELGVDPGLKVSAEEAANAIELLARNGLSMTEIIDGAAKSTVLLANATGAEFGNAADIATDAMSIFGISAEDMQGAVDSIVSVTQNSKFTIDDFSLAIRNGGAAAAMMNVSLEDFNTVIAATAEEMGSGMRAGTGFRNFLTRLTPSSEGATDAMQQLGLVTSAGTNMFFDANGQLKDMAEVSGILQDALFGTSTAIVEVGGRTAAQNEELSRLQGIYGRTLLSIQDYEAGIKGVGLSEEARAKKLEELNLVLANTQAVMGPLNSIQGDFVETTKQLTDAERSAALELIFGQDALGTAIGLANEGEESFRELAASMSKTDAAAAALERMDSVAGVMEILSGVIDTVQLQIGQAFLPLVRDLAEAFLGIAENVGPKIVGVFGGIADGIGEFVRLMQSGASPTTAFFSALEEGGVPQDFITQLEGITTSISDFVTQIVSFVTEHSEAFKGAIVGIGAVLGSSVIVSILGTLAGVIATILSPIGLFVIAIAALGAAWQSNFGNIQGIAESLKNAIEFLITGDFKGGIFGLFEDEPFILALFSARDAVLGIWNSIQLLITGDFTGGIFGLTEDSPFITFLLNARQGVWDFITTVLELGTQLAPIGGLFMAFGQQIIGAFSEGGVRGAIDEFILLWPGISTAVGVAITTILDFIGQRIGIDLVGFFQTAQAIITTVWQAIVAVISSVAAVLGPTVQGMMEGFSSAFSSFQPVGESLMNLWITLQPIVQAAVTVIGAVLLGLLGLVVGVFNGVISAINPLITTLGFVLNGVINFVNGVIQFFTGLFTFLQAGIAGNNEVMLASWQRMGEGVTNIVLGLVEAVVGLWVGLDTTLREFADNLVKGVIDFFTNLSDELVGHSIIPDMVKSIIEIITGFKDDFVDMINALVDEAVDEFEKFVKEIEGKAQDMKTAGKNIIQGLIDGIKSMVGAAISSVVGAVNSVIDAAKSAVGIESPSKVFAEIGVNIGLGLIGGIESMQDAAQNSIRSLFDVGGNLGQLGTSFAGQLKKSVFPQMEKEIEQKQFTFDVFKENFVAKFGETLGIQGLTGEQTDELNKLRKMYNETSSSIKDYENGVVGVGLTEEERAKKIAEWQAQLSNIETQITPLAALEMGGGELTHEELINAYFRAVHSGNEQMKNEILRIWKAQNQLNGATAEYEQAQKDVLALQKAQSDLAFLEQQQELLDLITEHGLNASDILGGLELGLGADTQGLVQAMTRAIQAIVDQANQQLQIASPSGVFENIGKFITTGLTQGINQTATNPAQAMESMLNRMVQPVGSMAAMPSVVNQSPTTTISKMAQVQFGDVSVSNDMDMQMLGDFIMQKVSEAI